MTSFYSPAVDHVARKIASTHGVEASYIGRDGAIDAVLEKAFDRELRQHVIEMGMRAMIPVRVFYRMPDGNIVGESRPGRKVESLEDFYTTIHVAGFAGEKPDAPPEKIAGDAYGTKVGADPGTRDDEGQLKLVRIRSTTRGRPVVGWRYGKDALRVGDKVKFKQPAVLQWTMGRTVRVAPGMTGAISQMSSKSPVAYLSMGGHDSIELPVHAIGHVYDVMADPALESKKSPSRGVSAVTGLPPAIHRLVMAVGFGRNPDEDDTPTDSPKFRGINRQDLQGYGSNPLTTDKDGEREEDMIVPPDAKDKAPSGKKGDDRSAHTSSKEPSVRVNIDGKTAQKRVLLGRRK